MNRTDLCQELLERLSSPHPGIEKTEQELGEGHLVGIKITSEEGAKAIGKPCGNYYTLSLPHFSKAPVTKKETVSGIGDLISSLLPKEGEIFVVGVGNPNITPDAYGPLTAKNVLATAHLSKELGFRPVRVLSPGVLAQTGLELSKLIRWVAEEIKPSAIVAVDALATANPNRLGCTLQISNQGISPGSGVANNRTELSFHTIGIPVIGIGVPTVMDQTPLQTKGANVSNIPKENLMVTPRDVDLMIQRSAQLTSTALNVALQPALTPEDIHYLLA